MKVKCILRYEDRDIDNNSELKLLYDMPGVELAAEYYPLCTIEQNSLPQKYSKYIPDVSRGSYVDKKLCIFSPNVFIYIQAIHS